MIEDQEKGYNAGICTYIRDTWGIGLLNLSLKYNMTINMIVRLDKMSFCCVICFNWSFKQAIKTSQPKTIYKKEREM